MYRVNRSLAEQLGAADRLGRGFSLDHRDIGTDVSGYLALPQVNPEKQRDPLPAGHRYFHDVHKETWARFIRWAISLDKEGSWFTTLTFKKYVSEKKAYFMLYSWLSKISDAYKSSTGARGLHWVIAQEWQERQVIHFHLILMGAGLNLLSRMRWENRWEGMGGGYARIYPAEVKAAPYLAKYMSKANGGSMRLGGTWRGKTPQLSLRRFQS